MLQRHQPPDPLNTERSLRAFISAEADCKLLCDSITETDQIYNAMLMDMTAPSGQYANPDDTTDIYSVFYAEYDANDNLVRAPRYSTISGYVDEEGNRTIFDEEARHWWRAGAEPSVICR